MMFSSLHEMIDAVKPAATVAGDHLTVSAPGALPAAVIDRLAYSAAFGSTAEIRGVARWLIRHVARAAGIVPASIHELYMAMGRGEVTGFTVPAVNIRMMTYTSARAAFRAAKSLNTGAIIFEIARSEIGYTEQRPAEYAAMIVASALREGFGGPVFVQADHVQVNTKKYAGADREKELDGLRTLIKEEIEAGFYNIDIDTSTLVDLAQPTLDQQQRVNYERAAEFAAWIRTHEPRGVTISVGGEIGEVGGKNSTVEELRAYMAGFNRSLPAGLVGMSKISVQTGTAHGGFVMPDGSVRSDVKIDVETLGELSRVARAEFGMGGAVQHGASTLPAAAFDAFPRVGACEIHLATDFQNMVYEHPRLPKALKDEMYAWVRVNAADERKAKDTEEQFLYKSRKKAIGAFKKQLWDLPADVHDALGRSLEEKFAFLMKKLAVPDTTAVIRKHVPLPWVDRSRDEEIAAAGGVITAAERKAEGLHD